MKRLFIAINLPLEVKKGIGKITEKITVREGGRWISRDNWHLTISFLSYQPDEKTDLIIGVIKEAAKEFSPPAVNLKKIVYGPASGQPRMVWLVADEETSRSLDKIKKKIDNALIENKVRFERDFRDYNAHITLVRFRQPLQGKNLKLSASVNLSFSAKSIDLMESTLKRTGAEYDLLGKADFC